jgi:predicted nucleic acid-binding protein
MLVVDASAVAELLLRRPGATRIEDHIAERDHSLHAPHLLDVEVLSALRRLVAAGDASPARGDAAVADLLDLPIARYPHDLLAPRVWALRENFSAYDATYVALAESITESGAPLLTADARLARAARAHTHVDVLHVA